MLKRNGIIAMGGASLAALSLLLTPAIAASTQKTKFRVTHAASAPALISGNFTPAVADPKLAAEFARRGFQPGAFRFTPSAASPDKSKAVRVAVRARSTALASRGIDGSPEITAITPTAYNLGLAIGWKRFALSGDVARLQGGALPGGREAAEVGVSYAGKKFTGRLQVGADRSDGTAPRAIADDIGYSLDVGGSYKVARNVAVTGGVRYRIERDRLEPLADERRDSQAVYIGTAFRF